MKASNGEIPLRMANPINQKVTRIYEHMNMICIYSPVSIFTYYKLKFKDNDGILQFIMI